MDKITVKDGRASHVVVYVNWNDEEILSEAEYQIKLEEETKISAADDYQFSQWLNEHYSADEIWNMTGEEKDEVSARWLEYCRGGMEEELGYERRVLI